MQNLHPLVWLLALIIALPSIPARAAPASRDSVPVPAEDYQPLETLARGLYYLETLYVDPTKVEKKQMVLNALRGIVTKLDPHTMFMPSKAFEQLTIDTQGKFGGVGIMVSPEKGRLIVINPVEGSPAEKAGIKSGDEIIAIDDVPLTKMKKGEATDRMRGPPDSKITLTIRRAGVKEAIEFKMVREIIKVKSVRSEDLGKGVLYTRISSFQDNTADELQAKIKKNEKTMRGLILDLRDNPGGLLDQAVRISDMFISSGIIVSTVGRDKKDVEREFSHKRGTWSDFPIVVLINGGSASASEIVAGALQDHERALVMGTVSFGKGSVQTLVSFPDRSGLKITVARYYTPKDRSIQAKGIEPDIVIPAKVSSNRKGKRKESDLKGHIKGQDLSDLSQRTGAGAGITEWPLFLQKDHQLVTAFTYLRGMGRLKDKG